MNYSALVVPALLLAAVNIVDYGQEITDYELCQEVAREVSLHVGTGLLTQSEADAISSRCFTEFAQ